MAIVTVLVPPQQLAVDEGLGKVVLGRSEEALVRRVLHQPSAMQEQHLVGHTFGLAEVVGGHDNTGASGVDGGDDFLDRCNRGSDDELF